MKITFICCSLLKVLQCSITMKLILSELSIIVQCTFQLKYSFSMFNTVFKLTLILISTRSIVISSQKFVHIKLSQKFITSREYKLAIRTMFLSIDHKTFKITFIYIMNLSIYEISIFKFTLILAFFII